MIDDPVKNERIAPLDSSAGLYHEAQADGVPYDDDPGTFDQEPSRS